MTRPGSRTLTIRQLLLVCGVMGASAVLLVLLVDGTEAAAAVVAVLAAGALLVARYVAGAGAVDSGRRDDARLLRTRAPGMGEWRHDIRTATGPDGALYYRAMLRPRLRRLFAAVLAEHHHVALEHQPLRAAELIGPELWPWLGHDLPGAGPDGDVPAEVLRRLVDRLEALAAPHARTRTRTDPLAG
ncbi:hypothetical protein ACIBUY_01175 [Streptomyces sp. NPDC050085]|uniref:hypothetical protein n=1 Tax=Streptomyces sp. NPDC050085 TaxID=3365600 RepID=UPI0037A1B62C